MKIKFALNIILLSGVFVHSLQAQEKVNIVAASVPFLRINADVRSAGFGDAGIATSPDAWSSYRNMSKTVFVDNKSSIAASYTPWMGEVSDGIYLAALTGYYKLDDNQAVSASFRYFNMGTATLTDASGNHLGSSTPREFALDAGYSRRLSDRFSVGLSLRYIHSKLLTGNYNGTDYKSGNSFAGDLSFYYRNLNTVGEGFSAGLVLSNLGSKISYQDNNDIKNFIPANVGLGIGYTFVLDGGNTLALNIEGNKLMVPAIPSNAAGLDEYNKKGVMESWFDSFKKEAGGIKTGQVGVGVEYGWNKTLFIRGGYATDGRYRTNGDSRGYLTAGAGLHYKQFKVDFSYLSAPNIGVAGNPAANTMRFGTIWNIVK